MIDHTFVTQVIRFAKRTTDLSQALDTIELEPTQTPYYICTVQAGNESDNFGIKHARGRLFYLSEEEAVNNAFDVLIEKHFSAGKTLPDTVVNAYNSVDTATALMLMSGFVSKE